MAFARLRLDGFLWTRAKRGFASAFTGRMHNGTRFPHASTRWIIVTVSFGMALPAAASPLCVAILGTNRPCNGRRRGPTQDLACLFITRMPPAEEPAIADRMGGKLGQALSEKVVSKWPVVDMWEG